MFPGATRDRSAEAATDGPDGADGGDANFVVVGAPLDATTTFQPGARFGPRRIRTFSEPFDDYDRRTDSHFSTLGVVDRGDVRAWDDVPEYLEYLEGEVRSAVIEDAAPLILGGEHTVSLGGVRAVEPDVFVCVDAHLDLRDAFDGNSLSHACVTRRILETGVEEAIVLGARTGSDAEWERAGADDVTVVPPDEVADWIADLRDESGNASEGADRRFAGRDVYLSVDIDGVAPAYAPGTGTMEPFGLEPRTVRDAVRAVAPRATGFDVVEVNDRDDGQAAALAGKLVREFVFSRAAADPDA